ncbi:MAG TPA: hypothetical protein GX534_01855 [Thermoanaerobacterales bacterium]|jgi:ABC-type multidrug transport system permease subunit|nr:hypothetical protein [Thermoanaerobacterales bacterium]
MNQDNFGLIAGVIGIILYVFTLIFFAWPLPKKIDTVLVISFVFLPAIIASFIYNKMYNQ